MALRHSREIAESIGRSVARIEKAFTGDKAARNCLRRTVARAGKMTRLTVGTVNSRTS